MGYNNYNRGFEIDEEKAAEFLENAVERIMTEEDIDTLVELSKLFKKYVPLTRRKYVIALMLKESLKHFHSFGRNGRNGRNGRGGRDFKNDYKNEYKNEYKNDYRQSADNSAAEVEEKPHHPRVEIDPDKATSIFVSIGKNRRVYPRDLVGLIVAVGGIDRERIGDIKVLANYSFVQLYTEDCQTVIDKLNGYSYRGRNLAVSFSRQKSEAEDAGDAAEAADTTYAADEAPVQEEAPTQAAEMSAEDAAAYAAAEKAAADREPFGN
ncbi:MAG: DbpA RNA binding domain-containing protein [Treponema sp.]|nr:DbpA RNA binding domain-containing protein [Treponema sp.]